MKKSSSIFTRAILFFAVCALAAACDPRRTGDGDVAIFDYKANYPATELTLSDIADVEYIRIGKSDDFLMAGNMNALAGETYVGENFIIRKDNNQLFMFDRQGNPIRKIGVPGRGPNEYPYLLYFVGVDEALGEAYIYGGTQKLLVYGLDGQFRRAIDTETPRFMSGMELLNDKEIICFDKMEDGGFFTISREDGKLIRKLPVTLTLPYAHDRDGRMAYPNILRNDNGTALFDLRTDTIHRITPRGEVVPMMVDVTKYPSPTELYGPDNAQFLPLFETDKYIIGNILCSPWITPDVVEKHYIYDKRQKQWFITGEENAWFGYQAIGGRIMISRAARALNPGYAAWYLHPVRLFENRDEWQSPELEKVLEGVAEDDNPILMLVKFK